MNIRSLFNLGRPTSPLLSANKAHFERFDQDNPLEEYEYVVFDTELTGFNKKNDEIVAIGAVKIKNLRIAAGEAFYSLIKPSTLTPTKSTLIHRITPQQLREAPDAKIVLEHFVRFCGNALLVGHYVELDIGFVNRALKNNFGGHLQNPCLCTMRLAQTYMEACWQNYYDRYNLGISYNLTELSRQYGLPEFPAHDALHDAMQSAYLFLFLVKKLRHLGNRTLRDLFKSGKTWTTFY